MIFHLDTDEPVEIEEFQTKMDSMYSKGGNFYVPKDVVVPEVLSIAPNATLNPMAWLEFLNNQFYQAAGVPQIILGGSAEFTEAGAKVGYTTFEQVYAAEQRLAEEDLWNQVAIRITFNRPISLKDNMQ